MCVFNSLVTKLEHSKVEIHYITLDKIAPLLSKLKKFTMLESLTFCDNNITSLRQVKGFSILICV